MARFRSVVVITFASHAKGPGFETRRNLGEAFYTVCNSRERNSIHRREGVKGRKMETGQMDMSLTALYYNSCREENVFFYPLNTTLI